MKTPTKVTIAGLLSAAGAVLSALAAEFGGATPESSNDTASPAAPETPRRGRKKEEPVTPAANAENPAPDAVAAPAEKPAAPAATNGEVTNPDYPRLRALIDPLIKGGQGPDVKTIIQKYSPEGGLKTMEVRHHAAFEKDIAALSY